MKWANRQFIVALAATLHASLCLGSFCNVADNITHSLYGQNVTFYWTSSEAPLASRWRKNNVVMMFRVRHGDVAYESGFISDKVWPIDDTAFTLERATQNDDGLYTCSHVAFSGVTFALRAQSQLQVHTVSDGPVNIGNNSTDNDFRFIEGDIFTPLACVANCNPACRYSWHWANGTVVAMGNTLIFEPFNRMYHGNFHCRATNGVDSDGNTFTVQIDVFFDTAPSTGLVVGVVVAVVLLYALAAIIGLIFEVKGQLKTTTASRARQSVAVSTVYETLHNDNTVSTEAVGQQDTREHPEYANMN